MGDAVRVLHFSALFCTFLHLFAPSLGARAGVRQAVGGNRKDTPLAILRCQPADSRRLFRCLEAHLPKSPLNLRCQIIDSLRIEHEEMERDNWTTDHGPETGWLVTVRSAPAGGFLSFFIGLECQGSDPRLPEITKDYQTLPKLKFGRAIHGCSETASPWAGRMMAGRIMGSVSGRRCNG